MPPKGQPQKRLHPSHVPPKPPAPDHASLARTLGQAGAPSVNVLVSFAFATKAVRAHLPRLAEAGAAIFIDSGAFSAWKRGMQITVREYATFLHGLDFRPKHYFTLDVIGDEVGTRRQTAELFDAGLAPVPIFTRGSSLAALEEAYALSPSLVGLGLGLGTPGVPQYVKWAMQHIGQRPIHWLGFVRPPFIARYGPYSVDSSSWSTVHRIGRMPLYAGGGRWVGVQRQVCAKPLAPAIQTLIRAYGSEPKELARERSWHRCWCEATILTAQSYLRFGVDVERRYGTRMCLVAIDAHEMDAILTAVERERALGTFTPLPSPATRAA